MLAMYTFRLPIKDNVSPRNVERKKRRYFPLHERVKTASKNDENEMIKERRI